MKTFYFTMALFLVVIVSAATHINKISAFQADSLVLFDEMDFLAASKDYDSALEKLDEFYALYKPYKSWFSLILDTKDLTKFEIHIAKMKKFLELEADTEFFGELTEFYKIIDTLPYNEGIHYEVIF